MVIFLLNITFAKKGQIKHVIHLELYEACRCFDLFEDVHLFLGWDIWPISNEVDEDCNAGKWSHQVVTHGRLQHLHHLAVMRFSWELHACRNIPQTEHCALLTIEKDFVPPNCHIDWRGVRPLLVHRVAQITAIIEKVVVLAPEHLVCLAL